MTHANFIPLSAGTSFEDGDDRGRILVFGADTGGRYSLMEYIVAPRPIASSDVEPAYGPHRHAEIEETFLIRRGRLQFLLEDQVFEMRAGDFVRVPPGTRHGYANLSTEPVDLLVGFVPGGFEELFVRHRSDQDPPPNPNGFLEDATRDFASKFET
jgi:mannose-6-phosphate isomerase-like protein (cupin superfamily)